jgi:hypothetical protein
MTTKVIGNVFYAPRYNGESRKSSPYNETIDGDPNRGNFDTMRYIFLNGTRAIAEIYNTDDRGIYLSASGDESSTVTFLKDGQPWTPTPGQPITEGLPIIAFVEGYDKVKIDWTPKEGKEK